VIDPVRRHERKTAMQRFLCVLLAVMALGASCTSVSVSEIRASMPDISAKPDSVYRGSYTISGTPVMKATVDVNVKSQNIAAVNIIEHTGSPKGKRVENGIIERIIEKQSLDIDAVSGATASSKAILKAVESALR
jgi:uncharacterized protein with FMN-binding domain